ncbi:hypothetical protein EWM64_g7964 [Hericium alpestre]|uniref:F-box domain-containing protein n=1 Tax=Hericium alpestre TaxID=135208 RepID=A0A4Y9ZPR0_9AGAM|nr:hypothetical protein EWM64_g7964 [Hericium alpestre]
MSVPRLPSEFWDSLDKVHFDDVSCGSDCLETTPKRIQQLRDLLTKMTNHANWHLPIFRLPPEILRKIFLHHARPVQDDATFADDASCATLLSVSQVCRRWREIAVRDPFLWTHVPIGNLARAEIFIQRSQGRPISLWGRFNLSHVSELSTLQLTPLVPSAEGSLERVEAISIVIPNPDFARADSWVITLPSEAAPRLRALRLYSEMPLATMRTDLNPPFGYELPMLRTLYIDSVDFGWEWIGRMPTLTSLVITYQHTGSSVSDLRHILNALKVLENLTELDLVIPGLTIPDPPTPLEAIYMPRLKRCIFDSTARSVIQLLQHISVPGDAILHVEAVHWDGTETLHFCNTIAQHYVSRSPIRPFSGLAIHETDDLCFTFYMAPNGAHIYDNPPDHSHTDVLELDSVTLNLTLRGDLDRSLLPDFITTFLRAFAQASPVFSFPPDTLVLAPSSGVLGRMVKTGSRSIRCKLFPLTSFCPSSVATNPGAAVATAMLADAGMRRAYSWHAKRQASLAAKYCRRLSSDSRLSTSS